MHGRGGEGRRSSCWHMWPVPAHAKAAAPSPTPLLTIASHSNQDFFLKDGRKIRVGDCALFQSGNSPAFIGIIRWFSSGKEGYLKLGVNWLYRPADVKLAKGILLEAAPNEVFYSFHKDEISAESLLHPCKVAFLCKGVELPSGISSFVCRRVYDIANKCLWWLTDQDYINERQEEVDQLLDKTQLEMHAAVQSGGRSPKPLNGSSSVQQLKSGSDSVQNSSTSASLQGKGKRREKVEQGSDFTKKDHVPKADNGDSGNCMLEGKIKAEVAKVTDKGALINAEGVERLVHLMQLDKTEKKIDLAGRILLADVIASTEKGDCLGRFVHLRGVLVLDDWLQEAHKGKTGDGTSPKEIDKSVEELLLALLRALDKLPINLHALQTSNIGKSVNHLRTHKNPEIQKKARSLVDTWKKRVDCEMSKINVAKSLGPSQAIAWSGKPGFSEVCQGGNRHTGSSESAMKSSVTQPSTCKSLPTKPSHNDFIVKSPSLPTGASKLLLSGPSSVAICSKDVQCKVAGTSGSSELQMTTIKEEKSIKEERIIKEEKSSGSSQSQNNSQSCSSSHAKTTGTSLKEDAKSSTAGSLKVSKTSGGVSRHRKSNNGFHGPSVPGAHKEANFGKSSPFNRNTASSKVSHPGLTSERLVDQPIPDHVNGHRLIVRLPNPGRSPARSTSGGSYEEPSNVGSRASSPGDSEKQEQNDRKIKVKGSACQPTIAVGAHTESSPSNDAKGALISQGGRLPTALSDIQKINNENGKVEDELKAASSSLENEKEPSFVDSKLAGDDLGMNLLASVATGEICKSELVTPTTSPGGSSPLPDETSNAIDTKSRIASDQHDDRVNADSEKHTSTVCSSLVEEEPQKPDSQATRSSSIDGKHSVLLQEHNSTGEGKEMGRNLKGKSDEEPIDGGEHGSSSETHKEDNMDIDGASKIMDKVEPGGQSSDGLLDSKHSVSNISADCANEKIAELSRSTSSFACCSLEGDANRIHATLGKVSQKKEVEKMQLCPSDTDAEKTYVVNDESNTAMATEEQIPVDVAVKPEAVSSTEDAASASGSSNINSEFAKKLMPENTDNLGITNDLEPSASGKEEQVHPTPTVLDRHVRLVSCSANEDSYNSEVLKPLTAVSINKGDITRVPIHKNEQCVNPPFSRLPGHEADKIEDLASPADASSASKFVAPDIVVKRGFDLNEGISGDENNQGESSLSASLRCSPVVPQPVLTPFSVSPISGGSPVPVTVAAPAKGPFVPPENLFVCKGELGWKGSAATSAFRPAEPRKVLEMPLSTSEALTVGTGKQIRPALKFDLNVPDEETLEDIAPQNSLQVIACESGTVSTCDAPIRNAIGLDLDLNKVDEITDNGQFLAGTSRGSEAAFLPVKSASGGFPNVDSNISRDFDLNNGPGLDEVGVEPIPRNQQSKSSGMPFVTPISGLRMNNAELGNLSHWFLPGNAYSAVPIPSFLPERGDQPYPIMAPAGAQRFLGSASGTFGGDIYRSPVLSSSPAMAFSPAASFPYASFPFGSSFPLASTSFTGGSTTYVDSSSGCGPCFPSIPSQLVGSANAAASPYVRPNVMNIQECSTSGGGSEGSWKWGRQNLDLNAGPVGIDIEGRDERLVSSSRQLPVAGSHVFEEQQARMCHVASAGLKRKEPEGGWEAERYTYKQPSFQ